MYYLLGLKGEDWTGDLNVVDRSIEWAGSDSQESRKIREGPWCSPEEPEP